MNSDHFYGPVKLFVTLAALTGISCVAGSLVFFIRNPHPTSTPLITWLLVAVCNLFVIIAAAVWLCFFNAWRRVRKMEEQYWWARSQCRGE
jgi:hypothetical protein